MGKYDKLLIKVIRGSKSKAYQVKQVRNIILKYKLNMGVNDE